EAARFRDVGRAEEARGGSWFTPGNGDRGDTGEGEGRQPSVAVVIGLDETVHERCERLPVGGAGRQDVPQPGKRQGDAPSVVGQCAGVERLSEGRFGPVEIALGEGGAAEVAQDDRDKTDGFPATGQLPSECQCLALMPHGAVDVTATERDPGETEETAGKSKG